MNSLCANKVVSQSKFLIFSIFVIANAQVLLTMESNFLKDYISNITETYPRFQKTFGMV